MSQEFEIVVTVLEDEAVISVIGELDFSTAPLLRAQVIELLNGDVSNLVIDLGRMEFIDSSGLGVLVAALKRMRERDGRLLLRSPSANTSMVLRVSGLDKLLLVS